MDVTEEQVSGVVVFRFGASETSVLPVAAGKKFSLFVERSAALETGMAFYRSSATPVTLRLYDSTGQEFETLNHNFAGRQQALFLNQLPFQKQVPPRRTSAVSSSWSPSRTSPLSGFVSETGSSRRSPSTISGARRRPPCPSTGSTSVPG